MSRLDIDITEFKEFFGKMEQFAKGQFKEELIEYVDTIGFDFLRVVQDEIVRRKVIDTRLLLASFEKGSAGNIWEIADGGLTLEKAPFTSEPMWSMRRMFTTDTGRTARA